MLQVVICTSTKFSTSIYVQYKSLQIGNNFHSVYCDRPAITLKQTRNIKSKVQTVTIASRILQKNKDF